MKKGINRALFQDGYRTSYESSSVQSKKCVFISHKSEDIEAAKAVAELLQNDGIDVYLDVNDSGLQKATKEGNAEKIVKFIEKALMKSTNILILVTEKTKESWWVPYEVGFSKMGKKKIASLLLKNVYDFPDYLKIETTLRGLADLKEYSCGLKDSSVYFEHAGSELDTAKIDLKLLNYIRG